MIEDDGDDFCDVRRQDWCPSCSVGGGQWSGEGQYS